MTARKFNPTYKSGPQPVTNELQVSGPTELGSEVPQKGLQKWLPLIMISAIVVLIGVMIVSGVRQFNPMFMMMPAMFIIMGVGYLSGMGSQSKSTAEFDEERKTYLRYLTKLRPRIATSAQQQVKFWSYHAPNPADLSGLVNGPRQWSRQTKHDLFGAARIGTGTVPADDKILQAGSMDSTPLTPNATPQGPPLVGPDAAPQPYLEPVAHMWLVKFIRTHSLIHDCPKVVNLRAHPTVSIGGDPTRATALLRAMICHLALFHDPETLQFRVLTDDPADPDWEWLKWLPHTHHPTEASPAGKRRLIYPNDDVHLSDLMSRAPHDNSSAPTGPYVMVINLTGRTSYPTDGRAGVTYITLGQTRATYQVRVNADGTVDDRETHARTAKSWQLLGTADTLDPSDATRIARRLAGWTTSTTTVSTAAPTPVKRSTAWHELIGAQSIEEVTAHRWRIFPDNSPDRLKFRFGHDYGTGEVLSLDIKEGAEGGAGPHGLLIGMTGSGKSEAIRSILLAAVSTHHPNQLNLLLCDFKGGSTFQGMEELAHTAGIITNLEGNVDQVTRFDDAVRGEIVRREELLDLISRRLGRSIPGVREYERLREEGVTLDGAPLPPMPSLFIVVDEFAELLQQHPAFESLFDVVARKGRSLRIHMLLATQSLLNVKLDKIEPNVGYRIALRTAKKAESQVVIGTPEANYIKSDEPGVGYLRVDAGEDPAKFRSSPTDTPYVAPDLDGQPAPTPGGPAPKRPTGPRVTLFTGC